MSIKRRDILKFPILAMGATILDAQTNIKQKRNNKIKVVVIGGGFGGLTFAKKFKLLQKNVDVTIIDKNELFMTGPM